MGFEATVRYVLRSWYLTITMLPLAAVMAVIKGILASTANDHFLSGGESLPLVGATLFLISVMLGGVMADYKESEKIPGDCADAFGGAHEWILGCSDDGSPETQEIRVLLLRAVDTVILWFQEKVEQDQVLQAVGAVVAAIRANRSAMLNYDIRAIQALQKGRYLLMRANVIRKTNFLPPASAMLQLVLVLSWILVLLTRFSTETIGAVVMGFTVLIHASLFRLIRDIDDPFENGEDGSGEIALFPLLDLRNRLEASINPPKRECFSLVSEAK